MTNESDEGDRVKVETVSSVNNDENEEDGDNDDSSGDVSTSSAPADSTELQSLVASAAHLVSSLTSRVNEGSEAHLVTTLTSCGDTEGSETRLGVSSLTGCTDDDGSDDFSVSLSPDESIESQSLAASAAGLVSSLACCPDCGFAALAVYLFTSTRSEWPTFLQAAVSPISHQGPLLPYLRSLKKCPPCRRTSWTIETTTAVL
jgi:hypothetical protein